MNEKAQEQGTEEIKKDVYTKDLNSIFTIYLERIRTIFEAMDVSDDLGVGDRLVKLNLFQGLLHLGYFVLDQTDKEMGKLLDLPYGETGKTLGQIEVELPQRLSFLSDCDLTPVRLRL